MYSVNNSAVCGKLSPVAGRVIQAYTYFGLLILALTLFMVMSLKQVTVDIGGRTMSYFTFAPTVQEVLKEIGIKENVGLKKDPAALQEGETVDFYTVTPDLTAEISNGMNIHVYHDRIKKTVKKEIIRAPVWREWDIFMNPGRERIIAPGKNGLRENTYLTYYRDDTVVAEQKIESKLVASPQPRVIACGSYEVVSRQTRVRGGKPLKLLATAYTHTGYRTAVGAVPRRGIAAVDPKLIPLGARMYIEGYGYAVAADTGGAIKGKKIDLFLETRKEALKWGRRFVNVYVLDNHLHSGLKYTIPNVN